MSKVVQNMSKILIVIGAVLIIVGIFASSQGPLSWLGKLPGDISVKGDGYAFYFPLMTSLLISVIISFILYLFSQK